MSLDKNDLGGSSESTPGWDPVADYDSRFQSALHEDFFASSGYSNLGYWDENTSNPVQACDNLVEKVVRLIKKRYGTILDVACGCGGTTKYLTRYFNASDITAINISRYQVDRTKNAVPLGRCLQMNATDLEFEGESFDNVICIEAAVHFRSRARFFAEAYRVLKNGGTLALADLILRPPASNLPTIGCSESQLPLVNNYSLHTYIDILKTVGFRNITTASVMNETIRSFVRYGMGWNVQRLVRLGESATSRDIYDYASLAETISAMAVFEDYILVSAEK